MPDSDRAGTGRRKRQPPRHQYRRPHVVEPEPRVEATVALTETDLQAFDFLIEPLRRNGFMAPVPTNAPDRTKDCPDLMAILRRCKTKGVELYAPRDPGPPRPGALSEHLLDELARASNPPSSVDLREAENKLNRGARAFKRARSLFESVSGLFAARDRGIPPTAMFELLDACALMIQSAQTTARQLVTVRRAREEQRGAKATSLPKKKPGRPANDSDIQALGVSRDDALLLRCLVRTVATLAPLRYGVGVSGEYRGYPRCQTCNNPAPALFASARTAVR